MLFSRERFQKLVVDAAVEDQREGSNEGTRFSLLWPELEWLAGLSQREFSGIFRQSAVKRAKWRGLVRNACVALGNSRLEKGTEEYSRVIRVLERLASSDDSLIAEHAKWALRTAIS